MISPASHGCQHAGLCRIASNFRNACSFSLCLCVPQSMSVCLYGWSQLGHSDILQNWCISVWRAGTVQCLCCVLWHTTQAGNTRARRCFLYAPTMAPVRATLGVAGRPEEWARSEMRVVGARKSTGAAAQGKRTDPKTYKHNQEITAWSV